MKHGKGYLTSQTISANIIKRLVRERLIKAHRWSISITQSRDNIYNDLRD